MLSRKSTYCAVARQANETDPDRRYRCPEHPTSCLPRHAYGGVQLSVAFAVSVVGLAVILGLALWRIVVLTAQVKDLEFQLLMAKSDDELPGGPDLAKTPERPAAQLRGTPDLLPAEKTGITAIALSCAICDAVAEGKGFTSNDVRELYGLIEGIERELRFAIRERAPCDAYSKENWVREHRQFKADYASFYDTIRKSIRARSPR